jgi:hypothetical protein
LIKAPYKTAGTQDTFTGTKAEGKYKKLIFIRLLQPV